MPFQEETCCNAELITWLLDTWWWTTPLHYLECLTPQRAAALLARGANPHARASTDAPSPIMLAVELERVGRAPLGSPAALVLSHWRTRLLALAMGTHPRLGQESVVSKLAGLPEVCDMIAVAWVAVE